MVEKTERLDLSSEEVAEKLFPDRGVVILDICKRISNDGKFMRGWRIEYIEKKTSI